MKPLSDCLGIWKKALSGEEKVCEGMECEAPRHRATSYNKRLQIETCTMNDIKGRWGTLGEDAREKYIQEAAALRAHGQAQDLSPEIRDDRIKMHLKKLKLEVSKLEDLGVETAILSFDRKKSSLEVFELSSKGATDFLDSTDTVNNFALHFKAPQPQHPVPETMSVFWQEK
ncbi:hypothetical protein cypCar_00024425 [Cyprinus carpio]|nr:hypothetical protein cypCar_00024425 [Cyprinus carpio]